MYIFDFTLQLHSLQLIVIFNSKVDPKRRPLMGFNVSWLDREEKLTDDVSPVLLSAAKFISENPEIEQKWKKFHSEIKVPVETDVEERTQASRDLFREISNLSLKAKMTQIATGGTNLHSQNDTNLCAYFATMSVLRHQLRKTIGNQRILERFPTKILTIREYLDIKDESESLFERTLAVLIGCVSPRALSVWFIFKDNI